MNNWQQRFDEQFNEFGYVEHVDADHVKSFIQFLLSDIIKEIPSELMADSIKLGDVTFREYLKDKYGITKE